MFNSKSRFPMERMKMTKAQFVQFLVDDFVGSQLVGVTTRTPLKMNKGRSKAYKNPYLGRVEIIKSRKLFFGWLDYEDVVNGRLARKGCEKTFKTQPMSGKHWLYYGKVEQNNHDEDRLYIRFYTPKDNPYTYEYLVDGVPATQEQIDEFTPWISKESDDFNPKQALAGLMQGEQVCPRCPMLEHILSVRINHTEIVLED